MKKEEINTRFVEAINSLLSSDKELSKTEIACTLGIKATKFSEILNFRMNIGTDLAATLCHEYGINPDWLLTGEGSMLRTDEKTDNTPIAHHTEDPNEGIPLLPVDAMAGAFTGEQQVLEYECERYVVPAFKGADFLIPVKGVSMHPRFSSGDIVACKRLSMENVFFQWNKVYVIDTDQGPLIKRLKPGSDKEHVLVVSDNTAYDPFELAISNIYHLALVIGVIRLE